jgi:hypothetical protein
VFLVLFACGAPAAPVSAPPAPPPPVSPPPTPPPAAEPVDAATVAGTWLGPACGERKWVRTLVFDAAGTYTGRDPISPCPPDMACVWSGILDYAGTWSIADGGKAVALVEAPGGGMTDVDARPLVLTFAAGALYDTDGCRFDRAR